MNEKSIKAETNPLISRCPLDSRFCLRFGEARLEVVTNSSSLAGQLKNYFGNFLVSTNGTSDMRVVAIEDPEYCRDYPMQIKPPDPGKVKIKEEYIDLADGRIVKKRLTGMFFYFGGERNIAVGPCEENANQVINFINNRYIQWCLNRGCLLGHAAAVRVGNSGIAMAGFSGAGKSTLALHMMSRGATFISNDRLLIWKAGHGLAMSGVAKLPRINPGTALNNEHLKTVIPPRDRSVFQNLSQEELWQLEHKYDVFIDDVFGKDRFYLQTGMDMLVILNWDRNSSTCMVHEVDISERQDLLEAFIKSPGLFYEPDLDGHETRLSKAAYIDHLSRCRVFECAGGVDFDFAARFCCKAAGQ